MEEYYFLISLKSKSLSGEVKNMRHLCNDKVCNVTGFLFVVGGVLFQLVFLALFVATFKESNFI